jgi:very-short-patch-repair endonuclease
MSKYSVGRAIAKEIMKADRRRTVPRRMQKEAAARPESKKVVTPSGEFWMSPIEAQIYDAMCREGLDPVPQYCIEGYYVDFAFPDVRIAVEADGREFHSGERVERDKKRAWIIRRAGWTMKRFYGDTIYNRAANCAYVVKKEVVSRRDAEQQRIRQKEIERKARNEAIARPFKKIAQLLRRS